MATQQVIKTTFQFRRGLSEAWTRNNPTLAAGEPGFELDTYRLKIGDGTTPWNELAYFGAVGVLRRDNLYNYDPNYVPLNGEVLLVDAPGVGLRIKIGDGSSTFASLPYEDFGNSVAQAAYYHNGKLYTDDTYTTEITPVVGVIYIDRATSRIYTTDGEALGGIEDSLPNASAEVAGLVKLYDTTGDNIDGSMTQRAITEAVNERIKASVQSEEEILILSTN